MAGKSPLSDLTAVKFSQPPVKVQGIHTSIQSVAQKLFIPSNFTETRASGHPHPSTLPTLPVLVLSLFFLFPALSAQRSPTSDPTADFDFLDFLEISVSDANGDIVNPRVFPRLHAYWESVVASASTPEAAAREFKRAAATGDRLARVCRAICWLASIGVQQRVSKGLEELKALADEGVLEAQLYYAILLTGIDNSLTDSEQYIVAAVKTKDPIAEAIYGIGLLNFSRGEADRSKGVKYLKRSARQGNMIGEQGYGLCFLFGVGVKKNAKKAFRYFKKSADQGDPAALFLCGVVCQWKGGAKQLRRAVEFFEASALKGFKFGQASYAWMLENGIGVNQNRKAACKYYKKAGKQEHEIAAERAKQCRSRDWL